MQSLYRHSTPLGPGLYICPSPFSGPFLKGDPNGAVQEWLLSSNYQALPFYDYRLSPDCMTSTPRPSFETGNYQVLPFYDYRLPRGYLTSTPRTSSEIGCPPKPVHAGRSVHRNESLCDGGWKSLWIVKGQQTATGLKYEVEDGNGKETRIVSRTMANVDAKLLKEFKMGERSKRCLAREARDAEGL